MALSEESCKLIAWGNEPRVIDFGLLLNGSAWAGLRKQSTRVVDRSMVGKIAGHHIAPDPP